MILQKIQELSCMVKVQSNEFDLKSLI
jgi:hypothetical protein